MPRKKTNKKLSELLLSKVKELAEGVVTEPIEPLYYDLSTLKHQPEILYRLDLDNYRYYYRLKDGMPEFFVSVTTLIKNTLPTPPALIKWLTEQEDGKGEAMERANYGTFLHTACANLLITKQYDLDKLPQELKIFCAREKQVYRPSWEKELKKDILAFAQFIIEKEVIPIAIEIVVYHPTDLYAGAIDLVCNMKFGKGRINAIVDLKSGRKGFYESHEIQLQAYKDMFSIHFPDVTIDKVFNWSPKAWLKSPTYNLKDQTEAKSMLKLPHLVALAKIEDERRDRTVTIISGMVEPAKGLEKNIKETNLTELIKENHNEKRERL